MGDPGTTIIIMSLFSELRRRNVFKVLLVYLIAGWLIVKLLHHLHPVIGLPHWTEKLVGLILLVGLPLALYFAYIYEITPVGLKKAVDVDQTQSIVYKTGQKLNAAVAVVTVLLLSALVVGRLFPEPPALIDDSPIVLAPTMQGVPPEIRSVTLENGLEIIVWPDHDIPNVALYFFVRAGGRNGYPGTTGLAHFFEHMMFNGTEDLEPGEFDRIMEAAGGQNNAATSNDVTVYQDWFPRSALETIFEIEAERLQNLEFDAEAIESERGVISSERRTTVDNNNISRLVEQVRATAYVAHPYQFPVIGWPSDIASWTQEDLENFYRTYYAPNNITMVVVGDVTPAEIFELAEDYLEDLPAQDPPAPVRTIEPEQQGERRVVIETDAQTPMLHVAFHAGAAADPETPRACTASSSRKSSLPSRSAASRSRVSTRGSFISMRPCRPAVTSACSSSVCSRSLRVSPTKGSARRSWRKRATSHWENSGARWQRSTARRRTSARRPCSSVVTRGCSTSRKSSSPSPTKT
jgi:hypothetical protein